MGRSETFDHTADLGLRVHATDLNDLFRTAAEGLFDVIVVNRGEVKDTFVENVTLTADSREQLLIDWLNELIFRFETKHRLFGRFDVMVDLDGRVLEAVIHGEPVDAARHILDHEVKAVTYHGLCLVHGRDEWLAEFIVDI